MASEITLLIKNMVCSRCIKVVREELGKLGLEVLNIELGEVRVKADHFPLDEVKRVLEENGFELIEDKKAALINKAKSLLIDLIYSDRLENIEMNISEFLEETLNQDYQYLSTLFSSVENITIEHYVILQKVERAKELLKYNELTLSEIAFRLGYSSVQHLSSQFRKVTGFTASEFKTLTNSRRKPIDKLH
ncbi:MAG: AraC family transcriptional regulator [Syntrophomonadaceae bacterium]